MRVTVLISLSLMLLLLGVRGAVAPESETTAFEWLVAVTVTQACVVDARLRRRPFPPCIPFSFLFLWSIAVPIYVAQSIRGVRGILLGLGAFASIIFLPHVGHYAAHVLLGGR